MVIGLCGFLQANEVTEGALFDQIAMKAGEQTLLTGAVAIRGRVFIPSRAERSEDDLKISGLWSGGGIDVLTVHRGSSEPFAMAVSLAW